MHIWRRGSAQFASITHLLAATLGLPAQAQPLRDPVLMQTAAAGSAFAHWIQAFAAYDGFVCAVLAWLLGGGDKTNVAEILPQVAKMYFGTTGWCLLLANAAGDRAVGDFDFFGIVGNAGSFQWQRLLSEQVAS